MNELCLKYKETSVCYQNNTLEFPFSLFDDIQKNELKNALKNERNELLELKKLLSEKCELSQDELREKITKIVAQKEYLFLHFPDGHKFVYEQSFLNRIRNEIDFFLKVI